MEQKRITGSSCLHAVGKDLCQIRVLEIDIESVGKSVTVDPEERVEKIRAYEHLRDSLIDEIDRIDDPKIRSILKMLYCLNRKTADISEVLGISQRRIYYLRNKGLKIIYDARQAKKSPDD